MKNKSHKVSVKIPAGVETGQQIRLAGQGEPDSMAVLTEISLSSSM